MVQDNFTLYLKKIKTNNFTTPQSDIMSVDTFILNAHPAYIESLYSDFKTNPESVDSEWRKFFEGFEFALQSNGNGNGSSKVAIPVGDIDYEKELLVYSMMKAYRQNAHLNAKTNPIRERVDRKAHLNIEDFGLTQADLSSKFAIGQKAGLGTVTLQEIRDYFEKIYCGSIGIEYVYIHNPKIRKWIRDRFETKKKDFGFDAEKKKNILEKLNETTTFEQFLGTKYLGQKRFSSEGGESSIAALDAIINKGAELGTEECVIGMAHRGRLAVLANIMRKPYEIFFNEFEGSAPTNDSQGAGDVKYHLGYHTQHKAKNGKEIFLKLMPNPSHLESVDPVVQGYARAKADTHYDSKHEKILQILIHGDAAIAGQGIVYEVLQMSQLPGYKTGGTIHFIINNQIGFTTDFDDARSSKYCTSLASIVEAPVFHVNGDDVEAVIFASELAVEYRQKFGGDVFIDMVCYRKYGHNEGDDPEFTQPLMYDKIKKHTNPRDLYREKLIDQKVITADFGKKLETDFKQVLQEKLEKVRAKPIPYAIQEAEKEWKNVRLATKKDFEKSPKTAVAAKTIQTIINNFTKLPEGFSPIRKANKILERYDTMLKEDKILNWAAAELLAYGSLLLDGHNVRMTGQDVKRGTFAHRHAIIFDEKTRAQHNRLNTLAEKQGQFIIHNSLLSEYGVLGFEFGYHWANPNNLVLWEAQFGDFVNGAQIMIDQYITSAETKWNQQNGLVMLLPHGYTGMGPEHSSARPERFLQACAELNIIVANITSPSNYFHALRRQLAWDFRKPLIVMSPKSLFTHKRCISPLAEISKGTFQEVLDDTNTVAKTKVKRVILCTGKIYYDLLEYKEENKRKDVAIVRLEQLYPYPEKQLTTILKKYKTAEIYWVQEEPENMGAWTFILRHYQGDKNLTVVSRKASASPATGFKEIHKEEQKQIVQQAFEK